ncbi:dihydrolipoyl dehydrogenase family protein [Desulfovibrio oxyclinae]|jgi:glutathione reductase (NADPH)|uniref:dihydrolipoyl dehydrogenase family protein n=1 Tax=Desulfovibrio oxyclinae TaxID=63560 RepID=UPI0003708D61|nr:NAD(P)/FAD-dependent oxidoreductase [Desulfovibrio oxyclinae]
MKEYDVIVIGAGPAGGGVAAPLAEAGKRVVMFEHNGVGGVCPLRGCNPKKALMSAPEAVHMARHLYGKGAAGHLYADWPQMARFKDGFTDPIPEKAKSHYESLGIEVVQSNASFTGPQTVEADGETYTAPHICICTGQVPRELDLPGQGLLQTSDDFLNLQELPRNIAFIGGGFISMEFAHIAARCGSNVTIFVRSERALREFDADLVDELVQTSREMGIDIRFNNPVNAIEQRKQALTVITDGPEPEVAVDAVFNCAGRVPAVDGLRLDLAEVRHEKGGIAVDKQMRSVTNPRIFAIGDVADTPFGLTPTASLESAVAASVILGDETAETNHDGIPATCFTLPPISRVGLLESEARERGLDFTVKETDLADAFSWKRLGETVGRSRILLDEKNGVVLGGHVLGHNSEEIANTLALIVRHRIPLEKVRDTPWVYPTNGYQLKYMI